MGKRAEALELAVLGLLHDAPMHGYELRKRVNALLGWGRAFSYGTLYPCLKDLVRQGYLIEDSTAETTGTHLSGRRGKIVYKLTPDGKEHFAELLAEAGPTLRGTYLGAAGQSAITGLVEGADALLLLGVIMSDTNFAVSQRKIDMRRAVLATGREVRIGYHVFHDIPLDELVEALIERAAPLEGIAAPGGAPSQIYPRSLRADAAAVAVLFPLAPSTDLSASAISVASCDFAPAAVAISACSSIPEGGLTVALAICTMLVSWAIAFPIGVYSATQHNTPGDKLTTVAVFILFAVPVVWAATMALVFICGGDFYYLFPPGGLSSIDYDPSCPFWQRVKDQAWHLFLPVVLLSYGGFAGLSRYMRASMLEVLGQDYVQVARAKGLHERVVILKHVMRNSLIPLVTMLAGLLPALIGGSVIIETIFSIPGLGQLGYESVRARDYPTVMALYAVSAVLTLIGILISDLLLSVVDPRIAFGRRQA